MSIKSFIFKNWFKTQNLKITQNTTQFTKMTSASELAEAIESCLAFPNDKEIVQRFMGLARVYFMREGMGVINEDNSAFS